MYQLDANNFTMILSHKWPLHKIYIRNPEDGHVNVQNM